MKKGTVITLIMMLSLLSQPVLTYADTAVPAATQPVPNSTQTTTAPTLPATPAPADGNADSKTLPTIVDANGKPVNPGTLPDSPLYWLSNLIQKIQVFFTFDPVKKAALEGNQALQKLAAAREMVKKGKPELAQKVLDEYTEKVQEAQKFLEQIKDPNSTTAQTLQKAMAQVDAKNIQVLSGLLDKLPPQAAEKLAVNIVRSMEKAVANMTDEEKKQVQAQWQATSNHVKTESLDAQTADALAKFQASLGLKGGNKSAMVQDERNAEFQNGNNDGNNNDGNNNDGNNEKDNTVLHNEDPNQAVRTIGVEKKAAAAKQEHEQEQKQEQNNNKEQENNKVKQQEQQSEKQSVQDSEENGQTKQPAVQSPAVPSPAGQDHGYRSDAGKGKDSNNGDSEED